jgi:hypothetical protein
MNKKLNRILLLLMSLTVIGSFFSCKDANTVSKEDRVNMFISGLNNTDRSGLYTHLYSGANEYGNADDNYWDLNFPESGISYSTSGLSVGGSSATATINSSGTFPYDGDTIYFEFVESDTDVWVISVIKIDSNGDSTYDVAIFD